VSLFETKKVNKKKNLFEGRATTQSLYLFKKWLTKKTFLKGGPRHKQKMVSFFFSSQPFFVRSGKCGEKIGIFSVTKKRKNYEFVCL